MYAHPAIKLELERLLKAAEEFEKANKTAGEHGHGSSLTDHIVALTRVVAQLAEMQRIGF